MATLILIENLCQNPYRDEKIVSYFGGCRDFIYGFCPTVSLSELQAACRTACG
jgi:hypothetical protein